MNTLKGWIAASELSEQLKSDPDYQARIRQRDAAVDAALARTRDEEKPILEALRNIGIDVEMISSQHLKSKLNREAIDILMKHLTLPYSDATRESLARALDTKLSQKYWSTLIDEYRNENVESEDDIRSGYKDGLAWTLSRIVSLDKLDDYIELVRNRKNGSSRILLLSALRRSRDPRARQALEDLADDPDLRKEIAAWKKRQEKKLVR